MDPRPYEFPTVMTGTQTVQLRHEEPEGGWHIDWMLSRGEGSLLVTIRLEDRLEHLETGSSTTGTFLGDHRRRYLVYEGPLSDGRVEVSRVATGCLLDWACHGDEWWITVQWKGGKSQRLRLELKDGEPSRGSTCEIHYLESSAEG